jgi:hypothetical protein
MLSTTVTPQVQITRSRRITRALLNLLGRPLVAITGQAGTTQIEDRAVTADKTAMGDFHWCLDGGAANASVLTPNNGETLLAYTDGLVVSFPVIATNTGSMTASVSSLPAKTVYKHKNVALEKGDVRAGQIVTLRYDATNGAWQLQSTLGNAWGISATDSSASANVITLTPSPALTAYYSGLVVTVKMANTNTGAVTINISALGSQAVKKSASVDLAAGTLVAGQTYQFQYDGTRFLLVGHPPSATAPPNPVSAIARNLVIKNTGTDTISISADEVMLAKPYASGGTGLLASSVSLTLTMNAGVGLNKLEFGATDASSTWYYIWLLSDGTTTASVASLSSSAPNLADAAFTDYAAAEYVALVGVARNDGSGNLVDFYQHGNTVWCDEQAAMSSAAGSTTYTSLSLTSYVPPIARAVRGNFGVSTNNSKNMAVAGDSGGMSQTQGYMDTTGGVYNTFYASRPYEVPMPTASTIYFKSTDTGAYYRITVTGYTLP